jgi:hypothetical protein
VSLAASEENWDELVWEKREGEDAVMVLCRRREVCVRVWIGVAAYPPRTLATRPDRKLRATARAPNIV